LRGQTYADYAWPHALATLYKRNGLTVALALAAGLTLFLALTLFLQGALLNPPLRGNFYSVFPHTLLVSLFAPIFLLALLTLSLGLRKFWRDVTPGRAAGAALTATVQRQAAAETAADVLLLKYLGGGHGQGCNNQDDAWTLWRRRFHHATFYGFMLCFAATCVATFYEYLLHWHAPFAIGSLPVLLGTTGGIGLLLGTAGLFWLNLRRHPLHGDAAQKPMDRGFMALLFLSSLSGLALLVWRDAPAMALLLALHLGVVMALFLSLPYGKFAHGFYRTAALLKSALEKRLPSKLRLGPD
jgi:citrate/tricarballylate utilization protein